MGVRESTDRFAVALGALTDADAAEPSLLPGWTVGHVLTHLARSADAVSRVLGGVTLDQPVTGYDSAESRNADVEAGAGRAAAELVRDVLDSAERLDVAWDAMTPEAWDRHWSALPGGPSIPAYLLPTVRWREVELHWVDLDVGYGPDGWPGEFVNLLYGQCLAGLAGRLPAGLTLELVATDADARDEVGTGPDRRTVSGPRYALACWLAGRTGPVRVALDGDLPDLAPFA